MFCLQLGPDLRILTTSLVLCPPTVSHPHCLSSVILLSVAQQARAEQEEEFISNTLFKKIQALQKEKETLAVNYEKEEEFLTNELSRKLVHVSDGGSCGGVEPKIPISCHWLELCVPGTKKNTMTSVWSADR